MQHKYFLYDPSGDGFQTFPTAKERDDAAKKAIADCLQDGYWIDDVFGITVGEITGVAGKANVTTRPDNLDENNVDEDGNYWDGDIEEKHDVEIQSVADIIVEEEITGKEKFSPDWSEIEATRESLREHMAIIAALRAKLAAAEASLAERGRMLELTNRVQRSYRAAVAAALAELRAEWVGQIAYYQTRQEEPDYAERLAEIENRLRELDATIAKIGLTEKEQPK